MIGLYAGLLLYNLLSTAVLLAVWPYLAWHCLRGLAKWRQRCGAVPRPAGPAFWVHAASVGEVAMIATLLPELRRRWPDHKICLSTMTGTGQGRARQTLSPGDETFFLPLDFLWTQFRALGRIRPKLVVLSETELWPNLIALCRLRGIPVALVNARLSDRSLPYYRLARFLFGPLLDGFALIACQSHADAERYRRLTTRPDNVQVMGNLKYDGIARPASAGERSRLRSQLGIAAGDVVLVAGSSREGEEEILLEAWRGAVQNSKFEIRNSKLILAPRHPERFSNVEGILRVYSHPFSKRSHDGRFEPGKRVLLWDTLGELATAYAAGDMAFVGGSLVPVGGHNPLEPAALGLPVVFGPHMFNAADSAECLLSGGGAVQVGSADGLQAVLAEWLGRPQARAAIGEKARAAVDARRGVAGRTVEELERALGRRHS